ncbi:MAG: AraC family transcriptional regulator [Chitinophagaceae bacterium]|nr:AraC family transcriptional regulator [Chitinophagaceae bacterium]
MADHIDAYWTLSHDAKAEQQRILPDGCVDIILNLGEDCYTDSGNVKIENGKTVLVGPMTRFNLTDIPSGAALTGIRFRPGGFLNFFRFHPLSTIRDNTITLEPACSPDLNDLVNKGLPYLDAYFSSRQEQNRSVLGPIIDDIRALNGQVKIPQLAARHFISVKQLERKFSEQLGVTPKQFANIIRNRAALQAIRNKGEGTTMLDIAIGFGYYDQAHLSNEIKKFSGAAPVLH